MPELPPIPDWNGLHPLVVHFPVALLLVAPLFVVIGLVARRHSRALMTAALILMVLGTLGSFVAVSTGEAAGKLAERTPEINAVLEHHEALAERTRLVFSVLTIVFAGLLFGPAILGRQLDRRALVPLTVLFLVVYGAGTTVLANTAHNGGRLVHEFGVRALMPSSPLPGSLPEKGGGED